MNLCKMSELETALKDLLLYNLIPKDDSIPIVEQNQEMAFHLSSEDYLEVLKIGKEIWSSLNSKNLDELKKELEQYLLASSLEKHLEVAALGVACLQLFVQINWAGFPSLEWSSLLECFPHLQTFQDQSRDHDKSQRNFLDSVRSELILDGEYLVSVLQNPELFYFAKFLLNQLANINNSFTKSFTVLWWRLRLSTIHQQLLDEKSERLHQDIQSLITEIDNAVSEKEKQTLHYVHYLTEIASFYEKYYDIAKARESLEQASRLVGLDLQVTGALGKRTKFQSQNFAQLTLDVEKSSGDANVVKIDESRLILPLDESQMPTDIKLDDEVRLHRIKFQEEQRQQVSDLSFTEQVIVLGHYFLAKRSKPRDALTQEELSPFLDILLRQTVKSCWSVKMTALLQRSILENDSSRTVERSLMQLETLVEKLPISEEKQNHRMINIYGSLWVPFWILEGELVNLLLALGSIKSALDRSLKIQLWSEVITCYTRLNLKHKAAEIILQQIQEKGESAHLYCLLGDATENVEHYRKALEISNNRSSRAYRSLGLYHYFRKEYSEAVENFQKSLDLNSFQLETLLRLGYSAIQLEAWEIAATTYWKYCSYESENFEAWNNLSNSYIKLGQKARAWKVLQEAVKCDYDNWKIWDNLMVVSTDCAEFEELIRSYHRLLDLKDGKHLDLEVLSILVEAISKNILDNSGVGAARFRGSALKLFGRLTSHYVAESKLWRLYAKLVASDASVTEKGDADSASKSEAENAFKAAQLMQKALGSAVQAKDWSKQRENCVETLTLASETVEYCLRASEWNENKAQSIPQLASLKMTLNSAIAKVKTSQISMSSDDLVEEVKPSFEKLQEDLNQVVTRIAALKQ